MGILLCLFLAASLLGTMAFVRRVFRLPAAFCPAVALACQVLCLYALSLPGFLKAGVWAVTLFGLAALLWCALRDRSLWRELTEPGVLFFFLYIMFFAVVNLRLVPAGFDNYTHWAVITKELYLTDALPQTGTMVVFTNYPPATALYQYYVLQFLGFGLDRMVLAMNILGGSMLACCFLGARWSQWRNLLARLVLVFCAFAVIPEHFRNLYVDALLGLILLAMGVMALWDDNFSRGTALPQALLGALLILTKMSGALLLLLHAALLVVLRCRRGFSRSSLRRYLLTLAGTCAAAALSFQLHLRLTFGQELSGNQFQLTLDNFAGKFQEKSSVFWVEFPKKLFQYYFTGAISCSRFFLLSTICLALLLLAALCRKIQLPKRAQALIPFSWGCALFYSLCLIAMYVFLMEESESIVAACFDRYFGTLVIYQMGLPFAGILLDGEDDLLSPLPAPQWALWLGGCVCCALLAGQLTLAPPEAGSLRNLAAANAKVLAAAPQVEGALPEERPPVLACVNCDLAGGELIYYVLRYAFFQRYIWPLDYNFWTENFYAGPCDPCYILWLEPYGWAEQSLAGAGIPVPEEPGLYYKDEANRLSLIQKLI